MRYQGFPLFVGHTVSLFLERQKESLDSRRPLCGLQCSFVLVFCLQASPKLRTTLEVGLKPARNDRTMVAGFALGMEKRCSHRTSKKCSSVDLCYNFLEDKTL